MDQKLPTKPKPPWIFARFKGRPRRLVLLIAGWLVTIVLFLVAVRYINKAGQQSLSPEDGKNANSAKNSPTNELTEEERNQLAILDLTEIVQFVERLQKDIDEFDSEAKYYHQHFAELLKSTKTDKLQKYDWVIDYFKKRWDKRLPPLEAPGNYRHNLEILLKTIKKALQKEKGYPSQQQVRDAINTIRRNVTDGELLYRKHNQLLDDLLRSIGEGPQVAPNTIQALVLKQEDKIIEEEAKNRPWKGDKDNPMPFVPPAKDDLLPGNPGSSDGGAIDELYREEKKNRSKP